MDLTANERKCTRVGQKQQLFAFIRVHSRWVFVLFDSRCRFAESVGNERNSWISGRGESHLP